MTSPFSYQRVETPKDYYKYAYRIADAGNDRVATCWDEENAKEIVIRLNSQAELLAACKKAYDTFFGRTVVEGSGDAINVLHDAIAKAEGKA